MNLNDRIKKYEPPIYACAYASAGLGIPGTFVPGIDVGGMIGLWVAMLIGIANMAGRSLDRDTAFKLISGVLAGSAAYIGGSKVLTYALNFIPGLGTIGAIGINSILNFLYTVRIGRFIAVQMEKPDFNTEDFSALIPDIAAMVFAAPSMTEIRESWRDYNNNKHHKI